MKNKKIPVLVAIAAISLILILYNSTKALEAEVVEIESQIIADTFTEEGKVVATNDFPIYSLIGGEIIALEVKEGRQVKKGDMLAVIDSTEMEFQLKQLEAELKSLRGEKASVQEEPLEAQIKSQQLLIELAKKESETAHKDFERIESLYKEGAVTLKDLEDAKNRMENANLNLLRQEKALELLYESHDPGAGTVQFYAGREEALQSEIDLLKYRIERSQIVAPADGIVSNLSVKKGDVITAGYKLMNIFQSEEYEVEVFIPSESAPSVKEGMKVKLIQDRRGKDLVFKGIVDNVAPTAVERISTLGIEEQRVKAIIKFEEQNYDTLLPGTVLDVEFTTDKKEGVFAVPKTALFPLNDGDALWKVEDGMAKIQKVQTGFENNSHVVIEKGLRQGDLIIVDPEIQGLEEGKKIRTKRNT